MIANHTGWNLLLTPECQDKVWEDGECLKLLTSKVVSFIIIAVTSLFVKMPQILKILKNRSAAGVSFVSQVLVLVTSSANVAYSLAKGFPISTWAESLVLGVQIFFLGLIILIYSDRGSHSAYYIAAYVIFMATILSPWTPMSVHVFFQICSVPFSAVSKVIQIGTNWKSGSIGQLSSTSAFISNLRSIGRLFSSIAELGDPYRIALYAQASVLNAVLCTQIVYYRKANVSSETTAKKNI